MTLYSLEEHTPELDPDTWVAPDVNLIGQIIMRAGSSVWFGSTLRGDNEPIVIGAGSNVQENCVFHTDPGFELTIGSNCTIGHKAMLHGCVIGDNSLVGMGAIVLNGARVGKNCLIGAGALITEGKSIPDNSMVMGVPGRVVRQIDAEGARNLTKSALQYQENMRRFRDGLKKL